LTELALPALVAALVWWSSTGAILFLDGFDRRTYRTSLTLGGLAALAALGAIYASRDWTETAGAYLSFGAAIVIWGWNEMAFLMGWVTGPRRIAADPRARGWTRFLDATATVIWHELAIAASAGIVALATWGGTNQVGLWTFLVLWAMRLSAKFNIFLGAPNVTVEFLPPHLAYLGGYFRTKPMNGFFPLAATAATLLTAWLFQQAVLSAGDPFSLAAYALVASLSALALLEHWLLFVPVSTNWLWSWGLRDRVPAASELPDDSGAARRLAP